MEDSRDNDEDDTSALDDDKVSQMDSLKPIPAFYCCYLLKSTVRPASVYIGSTPHPTRRLKQHNGAVKGGAVRTSRMSLRPWEMACIVTGFPSNVAALQFEWAWQNPHITLKIPPDQRITAKQTYSKTSRKTGRTFTKVKRPAATHLEKLRNMHILLNVPSFARWPLEVKFFNHATYESWKKVLGKTESVGRHINVDYFGGDPADKKKEKEDMQSLATITGRKAAETKDGIHALDVTYVPHQIYVEKTTNILATQGVLHCALCNSVMQPPNNYAVTCPNLSCRGLFHLTCLGKDFIRQEGNKDENICLPTLGACPTCLKPTRWIDIVMTHSVRTKVKAQGKTAPVRTKKSTKKAVKDVVEHATGKVAVGTTGEVPDSEQGDLDIMEDDEAEEDTTLNDEMDEEDEKAAKDYENWFFRASEEGAEMNMSDSSSEEESEEKENDIIVID